MKRKVVKHGPATYIVSLPSTWVKKFNICKGDEIDVQMDGDKLVVCADSAPTLLKTNLNLTGRDIIIEKALGALYKKGYDVVEVKFDSPEELQEIQHVVGKGLIGYEIVDEMNGQLTIKSVSAVDSSDFDAMLKRCFLFILSMAQEGLDFAKDVNVKGLGNIMLRDNNVNKLTDFLRRSLNKFEHESYKPYTSVYLIVEVLEKMGDIYKEIAKHLIEKGIKPDKEVLSIYEDVNSLFEDFFHLFYNFNIDKLEKYIQKKTLIEQKIRKLYVKEPETLYFLRTQLLYLNNMSGPLMITHL